MALKTTRVSDQSGEEIPDGTGAKVTIKYHDLRKGQRELDLTDEEAGKLGGRQVKRRGRRPAAAADADSSSGSRRGSGRRKTAAAS